MLELRDHLDLAAESFGATRDRDFEVERLDDDPPVERAFGGQEDAGHAAAAKFALQGNGITQGALKSVAEVA